MLLAAAAPGSTPGSAARAPATAAQASELRVAAPKPRQPVLEVRQLHLQAAGGVTRMDLEDADDQLRPVDHADTGVALQPSCLGCRKLVVGHDETRPDLADEGPELLALAGTQVARVVPAALLEHPGNLHPQRRGQAAELGHVPRFPRPDQHGHVPPPRAVPDAVPV